MKMILKMSFFIIAIEMTLNLLQNKFYMKNIIILAFILFPIVLLSQNGTTMDEYKYLTKGYAYQKEMGLDGGKSGYAVKQLFTSSNGVDFQGLFLNENQKLKGVIVILSNKEKPVYLGLPTNDSDSELKGMADDEVKEKLNLKSKEAYDKALLEFAMFQLSGERVAIANNTTVQKNMKVTPPSNEPIPDEYDVVKPLEMETVKKSETLTERSGNIEYSKEPVIETAKVESPNYSDKINDKVEADHNFAGRTFAKPPVVKGMHSKSGTVVVKMCIDKKGNIKTAKFTQKGSTTIEKDLRSKALRAVRKVKFSPSTQKEQCGTITFVFK